MNGVMFSHQSDDWATPKYIYEQAKGQNMFDPCPLFSKFDGLSCEWGASNFVNPPYSDLLRWVDKAIEENRKGKRVVMLIPARTDTIAFMRLFAYGCDFTFIIGRLRFNDRGNAPFPSVLVELHGDDINLCRYVKKEDVKL